MQGHWHNLVFEKKKKRKKKKLKITHNWDNTKKIIMVPQVNSPCKGNNSLILYKCFFMYQLPVWLQCKMWDLKYWNRFADINSTWRRLIFHFLYCTSDVPTQMNICCLASLDTIQNCSIKHQFVWITKISQYVSVENKWAMYLHVIMLPPLT